MIMQRKTIFASILLLSISFVSMAQGIGNPPPPMPPPPPGLPLDGVLITVVCIIVGIYFGVRKIMSFENK
jgi:hypothetical protein